MRLSHSPQLPSFDHRPGSGPTLVFLHYWGGSGRTWQPVASQLEGSDSVTLDFRGWGRSRELPGPYSLQQLAADTREVISAAGLTDYVLVGHSMGGKVAQLVAADRPSGLRGVVLVGPAPARPAAAIVPEYQEALSHAYDTAESVEMARDHTLTAVRLPAALREQVVSDSRSSGDAARLEWPLRGIAEDISEQTRRITAPVLVLAGEKDGVEPVEVLRENLVPYLADAELTVIRDSGHLLPLEAAAQVAEHVARFVERIGRTPGRAAA